jgi:hypothetical protein
MSHTAGRTRLVFGWRQRHLLPLCRDLMGQGLRTGTRVQLTASSRVEGGVSATDGRLRPAHGRPAASQARCGGWLRRYRCGRTLGGSRRTLHHGTPASPARSGLSWKRDATPDDPPACFVCPDCRRASPDPDRCSGRAADKCARPAARTLGRGRNRPCGRGSSCCGAGEDRRFSDAQNQCRPKPGAVGTGGCRADYLGAAVESGGGEPVP